MVADVHDTTTLWGGKKQVNVRFIGISKVHTTPTLDKVTAKTPGIAYCPVNCSRIQEIVTAGDDITFVYDGDIRDWGGRASDVHAGYTRKVGKHHRAQCTFPCAQEPGAREHLARPRRGQGHPDRGRERTEALLQPIGSAPRRRRR